MSKMKKIRKLVKKLHLLSWKEIPHCLGINFEFADILYDLFTFISSSNIK